MHYTSIDDVMANAKTIAVVGLSDNPDRPSYGVAEYLKRHGYRIIHVTPVHKEVLGEKAYPDLQSIPKEIIVDVVDVFRKTEFTPGVAREAALRGTKCLWLQQGIMNEEARRIAREAGIFYVEDQCMAPEHRFWRARASV